MVEEDDVACMTHEECNMEPCIYDSFPDEDEELDPTDDPYIHDRID